MPTSRRPIYVALLRGVNLGPHKRMTMEKLRGSFEALGFESVQTYIQSGNVVFQAGKASHTSLRKKIEERIVLDFGFAAPVIIRTHEEMREAIAKNPFLKRRGIALTKLHVIFLADAPESSVAEALKSLTILPDESCCVGREIYLHLPNGMGKSSMMNNALDRKHLKVATTRNWNTVNAILELCQECG